MIYAEGEEERVLRAVQIVVDEGLAQPILIGRPEVIEARIERFGLRLAAGREFETVNPESDPRYRDVWTEYHKLMGRHGITPDVAREHVRQFPTLIGAMLIRRGDADAMLCGIIGRYKDHLQHVANVLGARGGREAVRRDERPDARPSAPSSSAIPTSTRTRPRPSWRRSPPWPRRR